MWSELNYFLWCLQFFFLMYAYAIFGFIGCIRNFNFLASQYRGSKHANGNFFYTFLNFGQKFSWFLCVCETRITQQLGAIFSIPSRFLKCLPDDQKYSFYPEMLINCTVLTNDLQRKIFAYEAYCSPHIFGWGTITQVVCTGAAKSDQDRAGSRVGPQACKSNDLLDIKPQRPTISKGPERVPPTDTVLFYLLKQKKRKHFSCQRTLLLNITT